MLPRLTSRVFTVCLLLISFFLTFADTQWLEFNAGCPDNSEPLVQFGTSDDKFILFDVELRGLLAETLTVDSISYLRFDKTPGTVPSDSTGFPELPVVRCFVWVPDSTDLSIEYFTSCPDTRSTLSVYPAPLDSFPDEYCSGFSQEYFRKDSTIYALDSWYPDTLVRLTGDFHLRDIRIAVVDIYPVQYLPAEDSLRVWSDMEVFIEFEDTTATWSEENLGSFEKLIRDNLLGYKPDMTPDAPEPGSVERPLNLTTGPHNTPDYVILTAAGLDGSWIDTLAWHRADLNNFDVSIVRTDSVLSQFGDGSGILSPDIIRDFTETMWDWGEDKHPSYLLLIGDHEDADSTECDWFLPTETIPCEEGSIYEIGNDEWYTYFDEPDSVFSAFPDMFVGRLSTRETDNLADMIEVIRDYEAASSWPAPDSLAWRRRLSRLAGTPHHNYSDTWIPKPAWTDSLRLWCGYDWDNYYCGDACDSTTEDGSTMSSHSWVDTCTSLFEGGQQFAFYSDHGWVHYFDCSRDILISPHWGLPDSTFDDLDVRDLSSENIIHGHQFLLLYSCSQGTFNWTEYQQENCIPHWMCYGDSVYHYDFGVDCFAEEFIRNTEAGAIGVFAASWATANFYSNFLTYKGIPMEILYRGISRTGNAIAAGRLHGLDYFWAGEGEWHLSLGQYNLMGDPAVDIGDRIKFRTRSDLVISPDDINMNLYPTRSLSGQSQTHDVFVTVRNIGAAYSGSFDVELVISEVEGIYTDTLSKLCSGLSAGVEDTLRFGWRIPSSLTPPVLISFHATADSDSSCPESWIPNNDAEVVMEFVDFYPNEDGWPLQLSGSIKSPPVLCDIDLDGDLEIIAIEGSLFMIAADPDNPSSLLWTIGPYYFGSSSSYTIPASGDVCGDRHPEIVVDSRDSLLVFNGARGNLLFSCTTGNHPGGWLNGLHEVCLAELDTVSNDHEEIIILRGDSLYVLGVTDWGGLQCFDRQYIPAAHFPGGGPGGAAPLMHWWVTAKDIQGSETPELVVSCGWSEQMTGKKTGFYVFEWQNDSLSCVDSLVVEDEFSKAIPALGSLPVSGMSIAISRRTSSANHAPAYILDTDLTLQDSCAHNPSLNSNNILCCLMADWYTLEPGLDRIISPAENQCFTWEENGDAAPGWPAVYTDAGYYTPPFPALGNLDDTDFADLVTATREGVVHAYRANGLEMLDYDFPYFLPSEVTGGFVIADIDNDGKIELVFGTLDNYLHVWQLGDCTSGYAPWPQCQQNAARTGVLE